MSRFDVPLTEAVWAALSDGEARKRKVIDTMVNPKPTPDQLDKALGKLLTEGRIRRVSSGYYVFVSPFERALDQSVTLSEPAFYMIRRYAHKPATFDMIARSRFVPRSRLWACLCYLVQRGELTFVAGSIENGGVRFAAPQHSGGLPTFTDLSQLLNTSGLFRMSDIERATRKTSRMILNRVSAMATAGSVSSFIYKERRYLIKTNVAPLESLDVRLEENPQPVSAIAEFGQPAIDVLLHIRRHELLDEIFTISADEIEVEPIKWLVRSGLLEVQAERGGLTPLGRALLGH